VATRGAAGDDFAAPERVVELSTEAADEDPWVSPDRRLIVFSSDRSGDQELYMATR
jgi:Tol biopolymer transport system component